MQQGVQAWDRYGYTSNAPTIFIDNNGNFAVLPILIVAIVVVLKVIDYGWTAYDAYQSVQTLNDPNASQTNKAMAATNLAASVAFEALEPDDFTPIALPIDDLARKGLLEVGEEVLEKTGKEIADPSGQMHHIFSKKILEAIESHSTLNNIFNRNDFVVQAFDKASHNGHFGWHQLYDQTVVKWLKENPDASIDEFLSFLYDTYANMDFRFPGACQLIKIASEELGNICMD
jgi:hypothetical protein